MWRAQEDDEPRSQAALVRLAESLSAVRCDGCARTAIFATYIFDDNASEAMCHEQDGVLRGRIVN